MQYICDGADWDLTVVRDSYCVILRKPVSSGGYLNAGDSISQLVRNCWAEAGKTLCVCVRAGETEKKRC